MGEIRNYACDCGYQKNLFTGGGILGCNPDHIGKFFPKEIKLLQKKRAAGKVQNFFMENKLFFCEKCRELNALPVFTFTENNGSVSRFGGVCASCGTPAREVEEAHISCPQCGQSLRYTVQGDWD